MFELSKSFYLRTQGALLERSLPIHVKPLQKFLCILGGTFVFLNIPPRKVEAYHTSFLSMRGILCLLDF